MRKYFRLLLVKLKHGDFDFTNNIQTSTVRVRILGYFLRMLSENGREIEKQEKEPTWKWLHWLGCKLIF